MDSDDDVALLYRDLKITAIRIRRLDSEGLRFGHVAVEMEAQVHEDESPAQVMTDLRTLVDAELRDYRRAAAGYVEPPPPPARDTAVDRTRDAIPLEWLPGLYVKEKVHPDMRFRYGERQDRTIGWGTVENPCIGPDELPF